ncbi:hypothetical protein K439DRAFT_1633801 [Ramaria rubella]|nr:hypothetical protein K439DRAFT_1633801 [Ramaria rubella]
MQFFSISAIFTFAALLALSPQSVMGQECCPAALGICEPQPIGVGIGLPCCEPDQPRC